MKIYLAIFCSLICLFGYSQRTYTDTFHQALDLLQKRDSLEAQVLLLRCVDVEKKNDSITYSENAACWELYTIFYAQKKYREALNYLNYPVGKVKKFRTGCSGGFGDFGKLQFAYKQSLCYYNLNNKDTAVSILLPIIYSVGGMSDFSSFNSISNFFVSTLYELYGRCETRQLFDNAIQTIAYKQNIDEKILAPKFTRVEIDYSFYFLNCKVNLNNGTAYLFTKDKTIPPFLDKERLWESFLKNPAYKLLTVEY